jgi:hypothetical protein
MDEPKENKNAIGDKLIAEGCKAFGIEGKNVFTSRYDADTKTAIIVTAGGSKVRFQDGDKPAPLSQIAVTGINPAAAKRKVIAGAKKA